MTLLWLIKRILSSLPVFLGIATVVFALMFVIPGDPATMLLGGRADEESVAKIKHELGIDKPFLIQYGMFLKKLATGDLGYSYRQHRSVSKIIIQRFPATFKLAIFAIIVAVIFGVFAGIIASANRGKFLDTVIMGVSLFGISIPVFWFGLMLIVIFSTWLGWFSAGYGNGGFLNLILPGISLSAVSMGSIARITRTSMLEVMSAEYVLTARAKGLKERTVIIKHVLRNALIPIVTVVGGHMANLMTGAIATETIFAWPGLGRAVYEAITMRDRPVVLGGVLFFATVFVFVNLLVDILYSILDPRIKIEK